MMMKLMMDSAQKSILIGLYAIDSLSDCIAFNFFLAFLTINNGMSLKLVFYNKRNGSTTCIHAISCFKTEPYPYPM